MTLREFDALADRWRDLRREDQHLQDAHFAALMSLQANLQRDPKQRHQPYEVDDFLLLGKPGTPPPPPPTPKVPQTWEDMKRVAVGLTIGLGGQITPKEPPHAG